MESAIAIVSVIMVSLVSLVGAITLPIREKKLNSFLTYFISFSAGALLGDVFIHLLPEVVHQVGLSEQVSLQILAGILVTFIIEKVIHWKHHHSHPSTQNVHPMTTMTLIGDSVHNFIDGLVIGASYMISLPAGIATTVAVVLHEIPQEIGNFGVLVHGGYSKSKALRFNFLTALTAIAGTIVALSVSGNISGSVTMLSAFASGNLLYIASSDLIPEMHKETHLRRSVIQFVTMVLGIGVMMSLLLLE